MTIAERQLDWAQSRIRQSPCHINRASELGHPCDRYLVFLRTRWKEASLHSPELQLIFDEGRTHEQAAVRQLEAMGYRIQEQQRDYEWKEYQITGHIDGKIQVSDALLPFEFKSMSPWIWDKTTTIDDLHAAKQPWLRKYPAQVMLYTLLANASEALLILKNKLTGRLKDLLVPLDFTYAESLLKKAERVNAHVAAGTTPPPIPWEEAICGSCKFGHICLPEAKREALQFVAFPELEEKLKRRAALETAKQEFDALDKEVKETVKGQAKVVVGDFLITGKEQTRKAYPVKASTFWVTTIDRFQVGEGASDE